MKPPKRPAREISFGCYNTPLACLHKNEDEVYLYGGSLTWKQALRLAKYLIQFAVWRKWRDVK